MAEPPFGEEEAGTRAAGAATGDATRAGAGAAATGAAWGVGAEMLAASPNDGASAFGGSIIGGV